MVSLTTTLHRPPKTLDVTTTPFTCANENEISERIYLKMKKMEFLTYLTNVNDLNSAVYTSYMNQTSVFAYQIYPL